MMWEQLKAKWNESPWYVRLGIPFVALLLLFLKFKDVIGSILEAATRSRVDEKGAKLEESENKNKSDAIRIEGAIDQLEKSKEDAKKGASNEDSTDFHNRR